MLPFLKPKTIAGVIISKRKPDGSAEPDRLEGEENQALESAAESMIRAFHAKDSKALAAAFKDAFDICESEPHDEADHENDEEQESVE